jgi:ABC-type transport system involved in multi-copper enzyme maturation permease subunit
MNRVAAIAINTFRETVRDRVLYAFIVFAIVLTLAGILLGTLSVGQSIRVLEDIGLFTISIIGGVIAIFVGTNLVYKELDKRTIYLIFTKPIARWEFILGKFVGLSLCIFIMTLLMGVFLTALCLITAGNQQADVVHGLPTMLCAIGSVYIELLLVIALATFFSTFSTPLMSVIFTLCLWMAGHMGRSLVSLSEMSQNAVVKPIFLSLYYALPDLSKLTEIRFELISPVASPIDAAPVYQFSQETLLFLTVYVIAYVVMLLSLGTLIIDRREFN